MGLFGSQGPQHERSDFIELLPIHGLLVRFLDNHRSLYLARLGSDRRLHSHTDRHIYSCPPSKKLTGPLIKSYGFLRDS